MRIDAAALAAAALIGLAAGVPAYSRQPPAQLALAGTAVLAGQVIDETTKRPLGGVVVTLSLVNPPGRAGGPATNVRRASAVSSAEGRFVFRDVPAGKFIVTSTLAGYSAGAVGQMRIAGPSQPVDVAGGARLTDLVVRMWRLSTISGVARDDLGDPLVGVWVHALRRTMTSGQPELTFSGGEATDEQGRFRLSGLSPGTYAVAVLGSTQTNPVATVRNALQARAAAGPGGRPGIGLTAEGWESGGIQIERSGVEVDGWQASVGSGSPQPLPGPDGTLLLHPPTYYPGVTDVTAAALIPLAPGVDRHGVDFAVPLVPGVRVSGVLLGPDGPAARNAVRLLPHSTDSTSLLPTRRAPSGTADDQGRFVLLGVPPGNYVIDAYRAPISATTARMLSSMTGDKIEPPANPPPAVHAQVPITVGTAHVDGITVTMEPRASLSGRIVFSGNIPPPAQEQAKLIGVALWNVQTSARVEGRMTPEGTFEIRDVPPGRYHVLGESLAREWRVAGARSDDANLTTGVLTITNANVPDIVVTFTDKTMAIAGTVVDESGSAASDGSVVLMPVSVKAWIAAGMAVQRTKVVPIAADGSFQMTVDLPGDYVIVAAPPDVHPQTLISPMTVDADFAVAYAPLGTRVTIAPGDSKTQALTIRRAR
ncbi:MAG: carboxypeptidase-like regulatory domain-containing protein [Acidobacteria bacterium]|nr:carboxypeptidase-like regulatory domain-containing protein [Acidobacteriota bacterium]